MTTVWAVVQLIAFLWSVVLFVLAVATRERRQEAGVVYAVAGLALYLFAFADRLPGSPTALRKPLQVLPGVESSDLEFSSSLVLLGLVTVVYVLRMVVYLELFPANSVRNMTYDEVRELINDLLAPLLAFLTLDLCLTAALKGAYSWGWVGALIAFLVIFSVFFFRVLEYLGTWFENLGRFVEGVIRKFKQILYTLPVTVIEMLVWVESMRPVAPDGSALGGRLEAWISQLEDSEADLSEAQRQRLRAAYERLQNKKEKRRRRKQGERS